MGVNLNKLKQTRRGVAALTLAVALVIASGLGVEIEKRAAAQQQQALPSPAELSRTFVGVAKQVKPAVVNIDVVEKAQRQSMQLPEGFPQIPGMPQFGDGQPHKARGTGSGVIISPDGYILTNNHVAGDAEQIKVKLSDGREFKAKRIGADKETDIALIKIDATNLPYAKLGDSDKLEQGEWVLAIGSPFGLQQTMTAGIVSALGRDLGAQGGTFTNFIQTDASINPGNSGGPLVNMSGEVVGINTMIFSRSGGNEGVGFSIPANLVNKVYAQLLKSGKVTRAYLGLYPQEMTPSIARIARYNGETGVLVRDVSKDDSPAARAGLRSGDIIVELDGKKVTSPKQLTETVADLPVGKAVDVKYMREGRLESTKVTLGERPGPDDEAQPANNGNDEEGENPGKLGVSITNLTPELARRLKLRIASGVVVGAVQPDSPADDAGLQRGDVIHRINQMPVSSRADFLKAVAALGGTKEVVLQVERPGQGLTFLTVTLE
ncbi:MAG TPA: Do family serine endopeptidase [Blastocatellia bacterium]|nr:Do family serine endopeptidase [Blastocatellia bacterium]